MKMPNRDKFVVGKDSRKKDSFLEKRRNSGKVFDSGVIPSGCRAAAEAFRRRFPDRTEGDVRANRAMPGDGIHRRSRFLGLSASLP